MWCGPCRSATNCGNMHSRMRSTLRLRLQRAWPRCLSNSRAWGQKSTMSPTHCSLSRSRSCVTMPQRVMRNVISKSQEGTSASAPRGLDTKDDCLHNWVGQCVCGEGVRFANINSPRPSCPSVVGECPLILRGGRTSWVDVKGGDTMGWRCCHQRDDRKSVDCPPAP
jgi:hypothetical protein